MEVKLQNATRGDGGRNALASKRRLCKTKPMSFIFRVVVCFAWVALLWTGCRNSTPSRPQISPPFILPSVAAKATKAYICERDGWFEEVCRIEGIGSNRVIVVPAFDKSGHPDAGNRSSWTTDEWLFGWRGNRVSVLHMPGDTGLAEWGEKHFAKLISDGTYQDRFKPRAHPESRFDQGGAILATPPVKGFPYGRIIVAENLQQPIKDFFCGQQIQASPDGRLIEIDTSWLKVGHVDEVVNFAAAKNGSAICLVYPDTEGTVALLKTLPAERAIFTDHHCVEVCGRVKSSGNRWIVPVEQIPAGQWAYLRIWGGKGAGQVAKVHALRNDRILIEQVWNTSDGRAEGQQKSPARGMGLAIEGRCDSMPIWFEGPDASSQFLLVTASKMWRDASGEEFPAFMASGELAGDKEFDRINGIISQRCSSIRALVMKELGIDKASAIGLPALFVAFGEECQGAFALSPSMVNLQSFNAEVITLLPHGPRRNPPHDLSDILLETASKRMKAAGLKAHFIEGWNSLHRENGGVRCGMNVWRTRN